MMTPVCADTAGPSQGAALQRFGFSLMGRNFKDTDLCKGNSKAMENQNNHAHRQTYGGSNAGNR
jgi:hypothetical protein